MEDSLVKEQMEDYEKRLFKLETAMEKLLEALLINDIFTNKTVNLSEIEPDHSESNI